MTLPTRTITFAKIQRRGAFVAFGNTEPPMMEKVFGVEEQGADGDGAFRADTGEGYVAGRDGDYSKAMGEGCDVHGCFSLRRLAAVEVECCTCCACWGRIRGAKSLVARPVRPDVVVGAQLEDVSNAATERSACSCSGERDRRRAQECGGVGGGPS